MYRYNLSAWEGVSFNSSSHQARAIVQKLNGLYRLTLELKTLHPESHRRTRPYTRRRRDEQQ